MTLWIEYLGRHLGSSTAGIGVWTATSTAPKTIYLNNLPGSTASLIILYPYAGTPPDWTMDEASIRHPRLNIAVYSTDSDGGYQKSIDIRTRLDHAHGLSYPTSTTPTINVSLIKALGEPEYLGKDDIGRGYCVTNYEIEYSTN